VSSTGCRLVRAVGAEPLAQVPAEGRVDQPAVDVEVAPILAVQQDQVEHLGQLVARRAHDLERDPQAAGHVARGVQVVAADALAVRALEREGQRRHGSEVLACEPGHDRAVEASRERDEHPPPAQRTGQPLEGRGERVPDAADERLRVLS
jgi:hypothetical protein